MKSKKSNVAYNSKFAKIRKAILRGKSQEVSLALLDEIRNEL